MVGLSTHARGTQGDRWQSSEMENGSLLGCSKYVFNDDLPKVKILVQWSEVNLSRGRVTIARRTKSMEMDCGAGNFVFSRKYFTLTISVAAQHKWILRQLQPGGGKGFCSCARYICDILMQFLATKVTHVDALEVRWDTPERMDRRAWGFECSGVYVGTKL